jgi:hypothetical protein
MKKVDEIKIVKADIQRLRRRLRYVCLAENWNCNEDMAIGFDNAIITLEKHLSGIVKTEK